MLQMLFQLQYVYVALTACQHIPTILCHCEHQVQRDYDATDMLNSCLRGKKMFSIFEVSFFSICFTEGPTKGQPLELI